MKKITILALLALISVPGCCKKKIEPKKVKEVTFVGDAGKKGAFSEDAEEFILEDDTGYNTFDNKAKVANQDEDLSWTELENDDTKEKADVVRFDYNSPQVKATEAGKVNKNAKLIKDKMAKDKNVKVTVKGHSCKIAKNKEYNYVLSQERAQEVATAYEKQGVPHDKIKPVGFGATMLLTDEDGMAAQGVNRRAETDFVK